ncbi:Uncharacterized ABC transporter ATP-binding protein YfiC [Geodia barretti]|uniref:Uncharacterized ABC transporter ATP-binding protein YfiC n=1 Tax=Geodia barretti TaxID=519541 RepID=A0AA35RBE6_GEOBA|nr:Uncharacterized ABC transporter ATP-binding protein YfiC [Geodia barretti]
MASRRRGGAHACGPGTGALRHALGAALDPVAPAPVSAADHGRRGAAQRRLVGVRTGADPGRAGRRADHRAVVGGSAGGGPAGGAACLWLLVVLIGDACLSMAANACTLTLAHRIERDARDELYRNLLGKSQTYHDRQRIGDLVARATDDSRMLSMMVHPGILFVSDMVMGFITPIVYILLLDAELLVVPVLYAISFAITLRAFVRRLGPVLFEQRRAQGELTATLEEALSGIEVVKVSVREAFECGRFARTVSGFKELFVRSNRIEGFYIPMLIYGALAGMALLHGVLALQRGVIALDGLIAFVGLMHALRIPTFISAFSFSLLQGGIAGARRILAVLKGAAGIDENRGGVSAPIAGSISFHGVDFGYEGAGPALTGLEVGIAAGETVAIVGQTGSGKSSLTRLVNRTYDPTHGSVRVDGVDLRAWNLTSLRSQIASVEQTCSSRAHHADRHPPASQIRWADRILVLDGGRLVANGGHAELLAGSPHYRRIFSRYDIDLPPLVLQPNGVPETA